jgi:NAD(P)-dependent dehydrogenase (short-subunit alcohol dehydrogenase family)
MARNPRYAIAMTRIVLVTGANRGLGRELAAADLDHGHGRLPPAATATAAR